VSPERVERKLAAILAVDAGFGQSLRQTVARRPPAMLAGVAEGNDVKNDTSVFIVGGGPVGLAMAQLLDRFGIDCIVAERDPTTTEHPKSRGCWPRTMELFRQWGVEEAIRARGLRDNSAVFSFVDSIVGHEYGRTRQEPNLGHTPAWNCMVAQDAVEEELLRVVEKSTHARVLFSTEALSFAESSEGVTVRTQSLADGKEQEWRARYLVAADGAGSQIRRDTGIEMVGPSMLAVMANEYWRGDLSRIPAARNTGIFYITPKDLASRPSAILNTNGRDRWLSLFGINPDQKYDERSDADVIQFIRKQTGIPDLTVELINHTTWRMTRQVASEFRRGRVFLAATRRIDFRRQEVSASTPASRMRITWRGRSRSSLADGRRIGCWTATASSASRSRNQTRTSAWEIRFASRW